MEPLEAILAFGIGLPVGWVAVLMIGARLGGWSNLAKHFPDNAEHEGQSFYFRSGKVGCASYGAILMLRVCESGLRISVFFPFRFGHPPVFIPWEEFHDTFETNVLFTPFVHADIGRPIVASIALPSWLREHMPPNIPYSET